MLRLALRLLVLHLIWGDILTNIQFNGDIVIRHVRITHGVSPALLPCIQLASALVPCYICQLGIVLH